MLATELFAITQGMPCQGRHRCHWCGAACSEMFRADDPVLPFVRRSIYAKFPDEPWQCNGCTAFRRPSTTVLFLSGYYQDRQSPEQHSWFITRDGAHGLDFRDQECVDALRRLLLKPPTEFVLALRTGPLKNFLHLARCNENAVVKADTPLVYTVDGTVFTYTVHQLTEAMTTEDAVAGKEAGVADLLERIGPMKAEDAALLTSGAKPPPYKRGRPSGRAHLTGTEEQRMKERQEKTIRLSGIGLV